MTESRLRSLVALADTGSVRAAAVQLYVTESAVSSAVTGLARELGVPLVERVGRGVRLTPAGEAYVTYARQIIGLLEQARAAARGEGDPSRGRLRLAAVTTAADQLLPGLLAGFRAAWPEVELALEVGPRRVVWDLLADHRADLVIAGRPPAALAQDGTAPRPLAALPQGDTVPRPQVGVLPQGGPVSRPQVGVLAQAGPAPRSQVRVLAVRDNDLVVVAAPSVAFDLARTPWVLREPGSGTRVTAEAYLAEHDVSPPTLVLGSNGAVVAGAAAGLGAALVSRDAVRAELADGRLTVVKAPGTPLSRPWHAVAGPVVTATTRLFLDHLLAAPDWHPPRP
jgi:DNA-binding transcriptional LysR family regulator